MNLEILLFMLKVSVFIWLPIGVICFVKNNNRAGRFCIFVSIYQFIIYLLTKNKFNIKDPSFLENKSALLKSIFLYFGISLIFAITIYLLYYFCFFLKNEKKKLINLNATLEDATLEDKSYYELWELYRRYYDYSVTIFGKIRDEKLYKEAMKIKDLMLKKERD